MAGWRKTEKDGNAKHWIRRITYQGAYINLQIHENPFL
jgi:hypothetical protein